MTLVVAAVVIVPLALLTLYGLFWAVPFMDRTFFQHIWRDRTSAQREALERRLAELKTRGEITDETARLLISKEVQASESEIGQAVAGDVMEGLGKLLMQFMSRK